MCIRDQNTISMVLAPWSSARVRAVRARSRRVSPKVSRVAIRWCGIVRSFLVAGSAVGYVGQLGQAEGVRQLVERVPGRLAVVPGAGQLLADAAEHPRVTDLGRAGQRDGRPGATVPLQGAQLDVGAQRPGALGARPLGLLGEVPR